MSSQWKKNPNKTKDKNHKLCCVHFNIFAHSKKYDMKNHYFTIFKQDKKSKMYINN